MSSSFRDPREPWIIRGILITLASLFELCKGLKLEFKGDGTWNRRNVPGLHATKVTDEGKDIYFADVDLFEECIRLIRDANPQLSEAVDYLNGNFKGKISIRNLMLNLIHPNINIKKLVSKEGLDESIGDFTQDFQEFVNLSSLLKSSFRNRRSHERLNTTIDEGYQSYQHALMSRFHYLVDKCRAYPKTKNWWTYGPDGNAMIVVHEEMFKELTKEVFDKFRKPPLQSSPDELEIDPAYQSDTRQVIDSPSNDVALSISKADLYEIVDFMRETHDESSSRFASLEEQISLLVADTTEDLKSTLLRPWMNKDIDAILTLIASKSAEHAGQSESSDSSDEGQKASAKDVHNNKNLVIEIDTPTVEQRLEVLSARLRALRNEIRNNLHQINPRFEYYHCVLQSNIVGPALHLGVCSYEQLKETEEFQSRIVKVNGSFMLDMQESKYKERIDRLLSQNPLY